MTDRPERAFEEISAYLDDELTPQERAAVESRLACDADAQRVRDELREAMEALRALPRERAPSYLASEVVARMERVALLGSEDASPRGAGTVWRIGRRLAAAAMLFIAVGGGWWYLSGGLSGKPASSEMPEVVAPVTPSAGPEALAKVDAPIAPAMNAAVSADTAPVAADTLAAAAPSDVSDRRMIVDEAGVMPGALPPRLTVICDSASTQHRMVSRLNEHVSCSAYEPVDDTSGSQTVIRSPIRVTDYRGTGRHDEYVICGRPTALCRLVDDLHREPASDRAEVELVSGNLQRSERWPVCRDLVSSLNTVDDVFARFHRASDASADGRARAVDAAGGRADRRSVVPREAALPRSAEGAMTVGGAEPEATMTLVITLRSPAQGAAPAGSRPDGR